MASLQQKSKKPTMQIPAPKRKPKNKMKAGTPRFDNIERRLHRFYEPLVLLRVIEPTRGREKPQIFSESSSESFDAKWPKFLDFLSWICDYKTGGESVSSVVLQNEPSEKIYWLAGTKNSAETSQQHLKWTLEELKRVYGASAELVAQISSNLTKEFIKFSRKKVKGYSGRLCTAIDRLQEAWDINVSAEDRCLLKELIQLRNLRDSHQELCRTAYAFRKLSSSKHLSRKIAMGQQPLLQLSEIRHFIGRLRCWTKATKLMLEIARDYPDLVDNVQVKIVTGPAPTPFPPADGKTTLDSALGRMTSSDNPGAREEALQSLQHMQMYMNYEEKFIEEYSSPNRQPHIHSEALMLQHFYEHKLKFFEGRRYVGCSKPSCYCCVLFFKHHPLSPKVRETSGNVWINWALPFDIAQASSQTKHNKRILDSMTRDIRANVLEQIESRLAKRNRLPDSFTDMSYTLPTRQKGTTIEHPVPPNGPNSSSINIYRAQSSLNEYDYKQSTEGGNGVSQDTPFMPSALPFPTSTNIVKPSSSLHITTVPSLPVTPAASQSEELGDSSDSDDSGGVNIFRKSKI